MHMISTTKLEMGLRTNGTWCHTANQNGFMTLYLLKAPTYDDTVVIDNDCHLVVNTGHRNHPCCIKINNENTNLILKNYPVFNGEETWINVSTINRFYVYGFFMSTPLP